MVQAFHAVHPLDAVVSLTEFGLLPAAAAWRRAWPAGHATGHAIRGPFGSYEESPYSVFMEKVLI